MLPGCLALLASACGSTAPGPADSGGSPLDGSPALASDGPVADGGERFDQAAGGAFGFDGGSDAPAEAGGDAAVAAPACGFMMPNPASANLPNPASLDTSTDGIVSDRVSGLVWERRLTGHTTASTGCTVNLTGLVLCPFRYAVAHCQESRLGGHDDWRLPNILELISLIDFTQKQPQIDLAAFPDTPAEIFWSSTRLAGRRDYAHFVSFGNGDVSSAFIDEPHRVRCVRTGSVVPPRCPSATGRFGLTSDVVTDSLTGLSWRRAAAPQTMAFTPAGSYCSGLGPGYRLPSIKELFTILDFSRSSSVGDVLDRSIWQGPQASYWSSSINVQEYMSVWTLNFQDVRPAIAGFTNNIINVRCVR